MNPDIIVLDGKNMLWRCSDAFKQLSAEVDGDEIDTGGIYGFLGAAIRIYQKWRARVVVAWEGTDNFRFKLWPEYKRRDQGSVQELRSQEMDDQMRRLQELLSTLGVRQYKGVRCEADDVMGRISKLGRDGRKILIYSGDSDIRQLVTENVVVVAPVKGRDVVYDRAAVEKQHGLPPRLLPDLKALAGDSSDKIPGAKGIGEVAALRLLIHYGTLEGVLQAAEKSAGDWPLTPRQLGLVQAAIDDCRLFRKLTKIRRNMPVEPIPPRRDQKEAIRLMKLYRFRSLVLSAAELSVLMKMGK